jgi:UDP-glucose 4-epimerase
VEKKIMADRCLVTGGAGFIGSHIVRGLLERGHFVRVIDNLSTGRLSRLSEVMGDVDFVEDDLRDADACARVTREIDTVYHLAALPSVPRSMRDPWASHDHNVNATVRLLQASAAAGVGRLVFSSSSSVYGDTEILPKVEATEPLPRSPYAAAKLSGEQYVLAFARSGMVEGVALRYFNVFGPEQDPGSAYAAVIPAFMDAALQGTPARIFGDGRQTRDFTYIDNVVEANFLAGTGPAEKVNEVVANVGAGDRTSLLELVERIRTASGRELDFELTDPRPGDVRDSLASLDRARDRLGYCPRIGLDEGLSRTWEWFLAR